MRALANLHSTLMREPSLAPEQAISEVLVTGAAGFIGRQVTRRLAYEPGMAVRAGTRTGQAIPGAKRNSRCDILHPASLTAALDGVDAVVHCAVGDRAATVDGTGNLLEAARRAGVQRVVHLSSIAVYGEATGRVVESVPTVAPAGASYAHWKVAAEALCRSASGPLVVVLRPTIVYGDGSQLWITQAARRILAGRWGTFGVGGEGICNPVHVDDVAEAACAALRAEVAHGEAYNINGPSQLAWNAWFRLLAEGLEQPSLAEVSPATWHRRSRMALPVKALVRVFPALQGAFANLLLGSPASSELALFRLKAVYPTDKAAAQLRWHPKIDIAEGVQRTLLWLRAEGLAT